MFCVVHKCVLFSCPLKVDKCVHYNATQSHNYGGCRDVREMESGKGSLLCCRTGQGIFLKASQNLQFIKLSAHF